MQSLKFQQHDLQHVIYILPNNLQQYQNDAAKVNRIQHLHHQGTGAISASSASAKGCP